MMRLLAALVSTIAFLPVALSILSDEAFHIDYHYALLGIPRAHSTFFHRPQTSSNASLLYTISGKHVVGAVNPKDGSLVWRQTLWDSADTRGSDSFLTPCDSLGSVVSAVGDVVSSWDGLNGQLLWQYTEPEGKHVIARPIVLRGATETTDTIVLFDVTQGTVRSLATDSGLTKWDFVDQSGDTPLLIGATPSAVYYISKHSALLGSSKLRVTTLDPMTGLEKKQYSLTADSDVSLETATLGMISQGTVPFIYLVEKPFKIVKIGLVGTTKFSSLNVENNSGEEIQSINIHGPGGVVSPAHFLVHYQTANKGWADVYRIDPKSQAISRAYTLPVLQGPNAFSSSAIDANTYFTRTTSSEIFLFSSASHGILGRWTRSGSADNSPQHAVSEVVSRGPNSYAIRVAQTALSGEFSLIRNGDTAWVRPEMLAGIVAAAWTDFGVEGDLAHELEVEGHDNPLSAYIHRIKRHASAFSGLYRWLAQLPQTILTAFAPSNPDSKDNFMQGNALIVATHDGQVLALDANNQASIIWRYQALDPQSSFSPIDIAIQHGQVIVILGRGGKLVLDVRSGALIESDISTALELGAVAGVSTISGDSAVCITHDGVPAAQIDHKLTAPEGSYIVALSDEGHAAGYALTSLSEPLWTFHAVPGSKIVAATARPRHDPVASIGRVLGDRSVLYKYLNPNLALLTSISSTTLTMYLIEAVTGSVLLSSTDFGVDTKLPIASIISENWFAYSFYGDVGNSGTKAFQLVIHELYESSVPNDRGPLGSTTNHSMFDLGTIIPPHVVSQSFVIPEMISEMAVTQTSQGITTRQLLCVLPETNSVVGIPRQFLDPRRVVDRDPTSNEAEEGLFRYVPVLDFDAKWLLTHSRDVIGVKKVVTKPTMLESTSLVFAFGHDVFGTKLTPSMAFDILGKGFNKLQLVLTVVALAIGVGFLAPMVRRRQVDGRWKM